MASGLVSGSLLLLSYSVVVENKNDLCLFKMHAAWVSVSGRFLDKSINLWTPQFSYLQNRGDNSTCSKRLFRIQYMTVSSEECV